MIDVDGDRFKETRAFYKNDVLNRLQIDRNRDQKTDSTVYFIKGAPEREERDSDYDGRIDTWIEYEKPGVPSRISSDKRVDGKADAWRYFRDGQLFLREWDRNFDGKADFRLHENKGSLIKKEYDDNFDGRFERTEKSPVPA